MTKAFEASKTVERILASTLACFTVASRHSESLLLEIPLEDKQMAGRHDTLGTIPFRPVYHILHCGMISIKGTLLHTKNISH